MQVHADDAADQQQRHHSLEQAYAATGRTQHDRGNDDHGERGQPQWDLLDHVLGVRQQPELERNSRDAEDQDREQDAAGGVAHRVMMETAANGSDPRTAGAPSIFSAKVALPGFPGSCRSTISVTARCMRSTPVTLAHPFVVCSTPMVSTAVNPSMSKVPTA